MGTVIKLFYCKGCGSIMDEKDTMSKKPCRKCNCHMLGLAEPSTLNKLRYVWGHPSVIWLWVKENVLKRNR